MDAGFADELDEIVARVHVSSREKVQQDISRLRAQGVNSRAGLRTLATAPDAASIDRQTAVWTLGRLRDASAVRVLIDVLADQDAELRASAARALGELAVADAGTSLLAVVRSDPDLESRRAAAYALGLIGYEPAVPDLIAILRDAAESAALRGMVAEALADIGDVDAVPAFGEALGSESPEVRFWAIHALGRLGSASGINELKRLAADSAGVPGYGTVAEESVRAIAAIREREARRE